MVFMIDLSSSYMLYTILGVIVLHYGLFFVFSKGWDSRWFFCPFSAAALYIFKTALWRAVFCRLLFLPLLSILLEIIFLWWEVFCKFLMDIFPL